MNTLNFPITITSVDDNKQNRKNMDTTSTKDKRSLLSLGNRRSGLSLINEQRNSLFKRRKAFHKLRNQNYSKELASKLVKSKLGDPKALEKKIKKKYTSAIKFYNQNRPLEETLLEKKNKPLQDLKEQVFQPPKRKVIKTSEELLLEEMAKHKFKATPFNKVKYSNKLTDISMEESNNSNRNDVETYPNSEFLTENKDNIANQKEVSNGNINLINIHKTKSLSKNRNPNQIFPKKRKDNLKENRVFKARPMPNFRLKEVKISSIIQNAINSSEKN